MKHFSINVPYKSITSQNLLDECRVCMANCNDIYKSVNPCPVYNDRRKQGFKQTKKSNIFLCCNQSKTTALFKNKLDALSYAMGDIELPVNEITENIKKTEQTKVNRLIHNLTSINAYNIQEIYDLVPQETLSSNWKKQLEFIKREIISDPDKAAMLFLRIAKNNIHMKSEFSIYKKIERLDSKDLEIKSLPVRKVFLNVLHTFFSDFSNNEIYVDVREFEGKTQIDYETMQVAFYHLIENSTKYTLPNSIVTVDFKEDKDTVAIKMNMTSLYVPIEERESILNEGFSSRLAKKLGKSGDGIGLWRINQMIQLNHGEFNIHFGDEIENIRGIDYGINSFEIVLRKSL
ncbi:HAMP domain-containing histidine kinase [Robertkochia marina]|uniref:HAMP domain-containing histidine kinase n=1 Tax=Robertkochia marina TaxID=1227945 RepID=A0A4S3LXK7_9FLAO|nr:sensor histidine kinase [Robertkochia marina]THD66272.1 HAMP domain-containing histidine kinase [Robertkochia marina]TRZ40912.1 sensor histidine kinase [Robertkochia marina]